MNNSKLITFTLPRQLIATNNRTLSKIRFTHIEKRIQCVIKTVTEQVRVHPLPARSAFQNDKIIGKIIHTITIAYDCK